MRPNGRLPIALMLAVLALIPFSGGVSVSLNGGKLSI